MALSLGSAPGSNLDYKNPRSIATVKISILS
jgi:hypothetical protein